MARGFGSLINQMARAAARAQREAEAAQRRQERESQRLMREAARHQAAMAKEEKARYLEERAQEVRDGNQELADRIAVLRSLVATVVGKNLSFDFGTLKVSETVPAFQANGPEYRIEPPPVLESFLSPSDSGNWLQRFLPGSQRRLEESKLAAEKRYRKALRDWNTRSEELKRRIDCEQERHNQKMSARLEVARKRNQQVDKFAAAYRSGTSDAITTLCTIVLERSQYPEDFPSACDVAYNERSRELIVEYELPRIDVVPEVSEYRYVKTRDAIEEKPRKRSETNEIYQEVIAGITLRSLCELFGADTLRHIDLITFNGFVDAIDPTNGTAIKPHLISVRVTRDKFEQINLARVSLIACLRNLGARTSPQPNELVSVKPIIEFNMVDNRFVDQSDVLNQLESRPNLMELSPVEFEHLVGNLFTRIGLETRLTRASRDGGVDVVAYDKRPVLGGVVVIQAKRYRNTVGVAAVRELYGTMINEGANKGILVTTSGYGKDAFEFVKDKPIELIDGGGLLYLLEENGSPARIVMPQDS